MTSIRTALLAACLLGLSGCATADMAGDRIPADAVETTRTESNGDVICEYRVAGQLRAIRVVPSRGPTYFLYDNDGDGSIDSSDDNPPQTYFELFKW